MSVFDFNEHKDPTTNSPHTRLDRSGIPTTPGSRLRTQAGTAIVAQRGFPRSTPGSPARRPKCEISCAVAGSHSPSYRRWLPCGIFVLRPPERMGQQPNPGTEAPSGASFFVPFVAIQFQTAIVPYSLDNHRSKKSYASWRTAAGNSWPTSGCLATSRSRLWNRRS